MDFQSNLTRSVSSLLASNNSQLSFWEADACDKTAGPNILLFNGLKDHDGLLFDANSEKTDLVRFDWKSIRGTWLEQQACNAKNYLQMVVNTGSFRSLKAIFFLKSVDI